MCFVLAATETFIIGVAGGEGIWVKVQAWERGVMCGRDSARGPKARNQLSNDLLRK